MNKQLPEIRIKDRTIRQYGKVYIIAEMSANHNQSLDKAIEIIHRAKEAGADAVKLQTYTPDTITIDCNNEYFKIQGTIWNGKNLYQLYKEAYTPWDWYPRLKQTAQKLEIDLFSTPFDSTAVDFLEDMDVPVYKIASFELIDIPLLEKVAQTGKPVILSTGMASLAEIEEAVSTLREYGSGQIALLKCTSAYPAPPGEANLKTIPHLSETFNVITGLSDHTQGIAVPVAAVSLGACIIEKHFCLNRKDSGPDSSFSLEPEEFKSMANAIRTIEEALGGINYNATEAQKKSILFRRSLFAVKNIKAGTKIGTKDVRSIRPGHGLPPKHLNDIIGQTAATDIQKGTPLQWHLIKHPTR